MPETEFGFNSKYKINPDIKSKETMFEISEAAHKKIDQELKNRPEVKRRYEKLIPLVCQFLHEIERKSFLEDPINFISQEYYFRGMSHVKTQEAIQNKAMVPESGDYTGTAVFLTDSPLGAAEFSPQDGSFVVIDPEALEYLEEGEGAGKVYDASSKEFQQNEKEYIEGLPEGEQKLAAYTAINNWDTMSKYSQSKPWHTISMRKEQSISSVKVFVVFDRETGEPTMFDPSIDEHMSQLNERFIEHTTAT